MNLASSSTSNVRVATSSASSSPFVEYNGMNSCNGTSIDTNSTIPSTSNNPSTSSATSLNSLESSRAPLTMDHLQQLKQISLGNGLKMERESEPNVANNSLVSTNFNPDIYSYASHYNGWQYYPMAHAAAAFQTSWSPNNFNSGAPWNYPQSKKGRQTYQRYQTSVLEQKFQQNSYVSKKQREELRDMTQLTDRQIKIWFQNRRMKAKKEKNRTDEQNSDHQAINLPSNTPKLLNNGVHPSNVGGTQSMGLNGMDLGIMDQDDKKLSSMSSTTSAAMCYPTMNMMGMPSFNNDHMSWTPMLPQNNTTLPPQGAHPQQSYYSPLTYNLNTFGTWMDKSASNS